MLGFLPVSIARRLHRAVWRLYPPRARARDAAQVEWVLDRRLRAAGNRPERRALALRAVLDALRTLPGAWVAVWRRRRSRRGPWEVGMNGLGRDIGYALRAMRRRPGITVVAVLTLGVALGANAAIYAVAEATILRSLPYDAPDRVMEVRGETEYVLRPTEGSSWGVTEEFRTMPGIGAAGLYIPGGGANLVGSDGASRVALTHVSENFFEILGVELALGPGFPPGEEARNAVVLSHRLWEEGFGRDPGIVDRTIDLGGLGFLVVGVAPPGVTFPGETDLWVTQPVRWAFVSGAVGPNFVARLMAGVDRAAVEATLRKRTPGSQVEPPPGLRGLPPPSLVPLREALVEDVRTPLHVLAVAAVMVLLLGALNLAGVTVSQYLHRGEELRVRRALGAGRGRLLRLLLVETLVVGTGGALLAMVLAVGGVRALVSVLPGEVYGLGTAAVGPGAVLVVSLLALATSLVIGLVPALQAVGLDPNPVGDRGATRSRHQLRLEAGLIVGQVTLAFVLVTGALLLGRSLVRVLAMPVGFDTEHVVTAKVHLSSESYAEADDLRLYLDRALTALRAIPAASAVGATSMLPLDDGMAVGLGIKMPDEPEDTRRFALWTRATPGYFEAIGMPFLSGRPFSAAGSAPGDEVILSRAAAMELAGTVEVAGRSIDLRMGRGSWRPRTVMGVVEDVRSPGSERAPSPAVYEPLAFTDGVGFVVRTSRDATDLVQEVDGRLRAVDPATPPFAVRTTRQTVAREIATHRSLAFVSSFFGVVALLLAGVGQYGLMAKSVVRRRREIGIRVALGAGTRTVVGLFLRKGVLLALAGIVLGMPVVLWGTSLIEELLFEVAATDPWITVGTPVFLLTTAVLASWIPARRAGSVDPVEVLNAE